MLISVLYIIFSWLWAQYLFSACLGVAMAFFFVPFQVFMKDADQGGGEKSLTKAVALYTFSWSMGMGLGPFCVGLCVDGFRLARLSCYECFAGVFGLGRHLADNKRLPRWRFACSRAARQTGDPLFRRA